MPSDTCDTCADFLCQEQGRSADYKCDAYAAVPTETKPEEERQKSIREMKIQKGRDLCRSKRTIILKDGALVTGPYYFKEEDYLLMSESIHFLPKLNTKKFRPALEITIEHSESIYQIILLSEGSFRW